MAKIKSYTLGCKVNQYETQFVREGLLNHGYEEAAGDEPADVCIVNTCTVTSEGDSKSRQVIRRMARANPDAKLVVMGCYATRAPEELARLPGVAEVITDKRELPDLLGRFGVVDVPTGISRFGDRHRAYVKVQDGCLLKCSYCIIPKVRPRMHSRAPEPILDEIRRLVGNGYREIVLTGIHLGHYGVDRNQRKPKSEWIRLAHLLQRIVQLPGDFRVRISSIEATEVTRELLRVMAEHPRKICPHLHICLQSGSDRILRRMNRRWGAKRFVDRCGLASELLDQPALTTDVIVGFPGEAEADFEATCRVVRECQFSKIHIFPFSPRRGTPAAELKDQITKTEKSARGNQLSQIESQLRADYFNRLIGRPLRVLIEANIAGPPTSAIGTSCRYAPVRVGHGTERQLVDVVAAHATSDGIIAA